MVYKYKRELRVLLLTGVSVGLAVLMFALFGASTPPAVAQAIPTAVVAQINPDAQGKVFDSTISLGNVLQVIGMIAAVFLVWARMDKKQALDDQARQAQMVNLSQTIASSVAQIQTWINFHEKASNEKSTKISRLEELSTQLSEAMLSVHFRLERVEDALELKRPEELRRHRLSAPKNKGGGGDVV